MGAYQAKRGQIIIAGTLLVAVLALSVTLSIYRMSGENEELRARPVRETVLGITSDVDRALTYALSNASQVFRSLWTEDVANASREASETGRGFLSTWKRSVLTAYSNLGLRLEYSSERFESDWNGPVGWSSASCTVELDVSGYGFTGWRAERNRAVGLVLDNNTIVPDPEEHETTLDFSISDRYGGQSRPISDLSPENIEILAHVTGPIWVRGVARSLEYRGGGNYTLGFWPDVNEFSRSVILTVTTPEDRIVVAASYVGGDKAHVVIDSLDENRSSRADHKGTVMLGDLTLYPLPNSTDVYTGKYELRYVPEPGYVFLNWTVGNQSLAVVDDNLSAWTSVDIAGSTTITAFYGTAGGPPFEWGDLLVTSAEVNGASYGRGIVSLKQKIQGDWLDVEPPGQTIVHGITERDDYAVYFEPQLGYVFSYWRLEGDVGFTRGGGNPPREPNGAHITVGTSGGNATAIYTRVTPGMNAMVALHSRNLLNWSDVDRGWISLNGRNYAVGNTVELPVGNYTLGFVPAEPNQASAGWEWGGRVVVRNGTKVTPTIASVEGDGSITALYVDPPGNGNEPPGSSHSGPWDKLYVDEGYWLMPKDLWSGDDGKLAPSFSTGEDKQVALLSSPLTPWNMSIAPELSVLAWIRPNPPSSVKDITLELGFQWNNTYYLLGSETYQLHKDGVYVMPLDSTQADYPEKTGIIPVNSTILLTVTITFYPHGWGTFFLYHGVSWASYVYLGAVPV